ncbi:MAG: GTPase [Phycisphaerae bacterium]
MRPVTTVSTAQETHGALLTPAGVGALAVLGLWGPRAVAIAEQLAGGKKANINKPVRVEWQVDGSTVDDGLMVQTHAQRVELHLHGSLAIVNTLQEACVRQGVIWQSESAGWWERTQKSPLADDVATALSQSHSTAALPLFTGQLQHGGVAAWARGQLAALAAGRPFWKMQGDAQWLRLRSGELARLTTEPARLVLLGAPNAGKSTLANMLTGRPMAITSPHAGTTRDWLQHPVLLMAKNEAWRVDAELVDTAGVRVTTDELETSAIARTYEQQTHADCVLVVLDAGEACPEAFAELFTQQANEQWTARPALVCVVNKIDAHPLPAWTAAFPGPVVAVSATQGTGLQALHDTLLSVLAVSETPESVVWSLGPRQQARLEGIIMAATLENTRPILIELAAWDQPYEVTQ